MESENHEHCRNCVKLYCNQPNSCKMTQCAFGCGIQLHGCKMEDHKNVCQKCRIPCINSSYGCPFVITRESLRTHLQRCPASVIFCTMEWNRYPVYSKSRLSWVPFFQPNPVLVKGHLDVELAFRDQRILRDVFRRRCKKGKAKVDLLRTSSGSLTTTPKQHGNSGPQPVATLKSDSRKMAMALALSSLESKLRKKRDGGQYSGEEVESEIVFEPEIDYEEKSPYDGGHESKTVELECLSEPVEIELHRLHKVQDNRPEFDEDRKPPFGTYTGSDIPPPPNHLSVYLDQPLGLNVVVETLPKFQKQLPMYSIPCGQVFRRDEYSGHFKNVHSDIQGGLNGWLEHRCPLAQYGCTFVRYRLLPHSQNGAVVFNQELGSFGIKPCGHLSGVEKCTNPSTVTVQHDTTEVFVKSGMDLLTSLPLEILEKIASYLDGFSLCNFSRTCKLVREVCRSVLETKGMVLFEWEKRIYDSGSWCWRVRQKRWYFSTSFSPVDKWVHSNSPFMAAHLEECKYFDHSVPSEQFSYCFIVRSSDAGSSSNGDSSGESSEIGLEYAPGHEDEEADQIVLECQMSEESVTDSEKSTNSEYELLEGES